MPLPSKTPPAASRRHLAIVLAMPLAAAMLAFASPAHAASASIVIDGVKYTVDTDAPAAAGATVTENNREAGPVLVIPDNVTIGRTVYPVTTIGDHAFPSRELTSVTLPDSIVSIESFAFYNNPFTSLTLPDGLVTIGDQALAYTGMSSVNLPDSLVTIGDAAFFNSRLTSVKLPDGLVSVSNFAFDSSRLASVDLPDSLESIGYSAFSNNQLTSVVVPTGVTSIGDGAFQGNENLTQVRFAGAAPRTISGADHARPSLGRAAGLTVAFPAEYLAPTPQQGSYTTPQWLGYAAHPTSHTVSFNSGGGTIMDPVTVPHGELWEPPSAPVREGYTFTGWYTTPALDTRVNAELRVTENLTVYAGWQPTSVPVEPVIPDWVSSVSGSLGALALPRLVN